MDRPKFVSVTRARPCPICKAPDRCSIALDGGLVVCRARVRRHERDVGNVFGWRHLGQSADGADKWRFSPDQTDSPRGKVERPKPVPVALAPALDYAALAADAREELDYTALRVFAASLGLTENALSRLGVGMLTLARCDPEWPGWAWCFPQTDPRGRVVGLRLRTSTGRKFSAPGGVHGLFVPGNLKADRTLVVCEGPTDTAALLDMGVEAVGRSSALTCHDMLLEALSLWRCRDLVVVANRDDPDQRGRHAGQDGARRLIEDARGRGVRCRLVVPPGTKDMRDWLKLGAKHDDLACLFDSACILPAR